MLLGRYDDAIANYDRALELRPDWPAAATNRAIAVVRRERRNVKGDDAGGTDGKLGADEFVFDGEPGPGGADAKTAGEGEPLSDEAVRALWMRRVQTKPADYLRVKFAVQQEARASAGARGNR